MQPLLIRGAFIWACSRAGLALLGWLMMGLEGPISFSVTAKAAAWIAWVTCGIGILDFRRRNEHLLLANLGVRQRTLGLLAALPALVGELAMTLLVAGGTARG